MATERYHEFITERMNRIIRRNTIIITHVGIVIVALLDVFKESEEFWPLEFKLISLGVLTAFSAIGWWRLHRLDSSLNTKPIRFIWIMTALIAAVILFLADFGSVYIYIALVPIFLSAFYYSKEMIYAIYGIIGVAILLQPVVQEVLFGDLPAVNGVSDFSWYNYALNLMAYITMISVSRLMVDATQVGNEDKLAIQENALQTTIQKERIEAIVTSIDDAIIGVNDRGVIDFANSAARSMLNSNVDVVGKKLPDVASLNRLGGKKFNLQSWLKKASGSESTTLSLVYGPDDHITVSLIANPIETDSHGLAGHVIIMRDITEEVSSSEERHRYIALLSHELRTPLAILEAQLSNQIMYAKKGDVKQMTQTAREAHTSAMRLNSVVNNLTKFVEIDKARDELVETTVIDIDEMLSSITDSYERQVVTRDLSVSYSNDSSQAQEVRSNTEHLLNIIKVIMDNAIKYTNSGSVRVRLTTNDSHAVISVSDTGPGISKHMQNLIFTASGQAQHYETREDEGLGLGLYYAQRLADLIDIDLSVESRLGKGSTFTITVPLA